MSALADEIEADADMLARDYPRGATPTDLCGYYGVPLDAVETALAVLAVRRVPTPFLKRAAPKDAAAVSMGQKGGRARAAKLDAGERSEIAKRAASARWASAEEVRILNQVKAQIGADYPAPLPPNKKTRTDPELRADLMKPRLVEFARAYPVGATVVEMAEFFGVSLVRTREALGVLCDEGYADTSERSYPGNRITVLVNGMAELPPPLTTLQEAAYCEITKRKDATGKAVVNYTHVGAVIGATQASVIQLCYALEGKRYLRRITPYDRVGPRTSPVYEVLSPRSQIVGRLMTYDGE